jgi:hypothetical protein
VSARFSAKLLAVRRGGSAIMSFWDPNLGEDSEPSDAISPRIVDKARDVVIRGSAMFEIECQRLEVFSSTEVKAI